MIPPARRWLGAALWLGLLGATAGPAYDAIHTVSGATRYADPQLLRSVWWCPPLFAFAAVAIGTGTPAYDFFLLRRVPRSPSTGAIVSSMSMFTLAYFLSGFLVGPWWPKAVILSAVFVVTVGCAETDWRSALPNAAGAALGGWAVEYCLTQRGLFFHRDTELAGVAGWIPPLYATASVAVGAIGRRLVGGGASASSTRP